MAGAGLDPRRGLLPPFMKADIEGLDDVLERLESADRAATASASRRRSSCAGSSPRAAWARRAARASTPTRSPTTSSRRRGGQARDARRRRHRLAGQRPDELDRPAGDRRPAAPCGRRSRARGVRALVIASSNPLLFSRRRRHQGVHARWTRPAARELLRRARTRCCASFEQLERRDDRRGQRPGLRRRLRAGDGLRRAHRRAVGALRPARDQARDHPRLRRHPAPAAARGREQGAGDEPRRRRRSAPRRPTSSASSTASCSTTSCSTPRSRGRASSPARRRWRSSAIKEVSAKGDLDEGIEAEKAALRRASSPARTPRRASAPSWASASRRGAGA